MQSSLLPFPPFPPPPRYIAPSAEFFPGETVTIYRLAITQRPFIEGRATIIAHDLEIPGLYRVRFEGETQIRERLVHGGEWQSDPEVQLARLRTEWLMTMTPELLATFFPDEFGTGGA